MKLSVILLSIAAAGIIAACSPQQRAEMEADKMASFNLTPKQTEIANALIEGYKKDAGRQLLRTQDYARAACYAKSVQMPQMYENGHLLYLRNYTEADRNFYAFFAKHGISESMAYQISEKFHFGYDGCSTSAQIKKRLGQ